MKFLDFLVLILALGVISAGAYYIYLEVDRTPYKITPLQRQDISTPDENIPVEQSKLFFPNIRFPTRTITYDFDSKCTQEKRDQMEKAFEIFEEKTILDFSYSPEGELYIACSELAPEPENEGYFVAGEGGPTKVLKGELYTIILEGKISLYKDESCDEPHIAVHELLHVLGFDHNSNPRSVLFPTLDCRQKYDQYFFDRVNQLYEADSLSDLDFGNVSLERNGRYIDFVVEVKNRGLASASNVVLRLFADSTKVQDFDLGNIDIGTKKIFTVKNLKIPGSAEGLEFSIDPDNREKELFEDNNKASFLFEK